MAAPIATTLVRIDAPVGLLPEYVLDQLLNRGYARRAAYQDNLIDRARIHPGVLHRLPARVRRGVDQIADHLLERGARQAVLQMLGTGLIGGDERQIDLRGLGSGKLDLGLLCGFLETLQSHPVLAQIDAVFVLELVDQPVDYALIEIVAAKVRVAVRRLHFKHAIAQFQDRNIERTAAQIVNRDALFLAFLVESVGERRGGRLIDDSLDLQTGNLARILGRLTLRIIEVSGNRYDRLGDRMAEITFRGFFHLLEHGGGDFRW